MLYSLLLLLLLAHCNICSTASFQPDSGSRLHWVGPKLRLALRQAKRSLVSTPIKLYSPGEAWKTATQSDDVEANEVDEISGDYVDSGNFGYYGNFGNYNQLERVGEEAEQVAQMIKSLQQAIQAKRAIQAQQAIQAKQMMEPKLKRPKIDGRIRILKVCILCFLLYFRCSTVQIREE